ncbi:PLP-dependent aminotransferase family protein [Acinetobacter sp. CFCC 10889]|uniref:aminotransferase-like domain-containing protein n=1 Tax=Acinetobacter sp. CFCC 10889 TaxID=1775557 RepID=UPI000DD052DA|nr:PLP-dependent aminotransferase family protein [Acinetobacter sp. CFCC 10889]
MHTTKIEYVMSVIRQQISDKQLLTGARLLSVRQQAKALNCSVSTVVEAYARLVAESIIESRVGSGYYVSGKKTVVKLIEKTVQYEREIDPLWISRQSLDAKPEVIKAGCGWLPVEWMPEMSIRRALKQVAKSPASVLIDYPIPHGHAGLRQWIARKNESYDIQLDIAQILMTDSATQSIDLIFRKLLKAGDVILIDDPCYFNFLALIKAHQLQVIAIPFTENGPSVEHFEQALLHQPKLYLTNTGIHNPTGANLSIATAYQIAKLVEQGNLTIIEDDIFSEFEMMPAPRYSSLMGFKRVVQIGSFSKTVTAAIRCGYIISHEKFIDECIDLKIATNFSSGHLNAEIIYHTLLDSNYKKHVESLKKQLLKAMQLTMQRLAALGIKPLIVPKAGIFLWCKLPENVDAPTLSKLCLKQGVILAPGNSFSQSLHASQYMRFNVAQCNDKKVFDVLENALEDLLTMKINTD